MALVELVTVNDVTTPDTELGEQLRNRMTAQRSQNNYQAFIDALIDDAEVVYLAN